MIKLKHGRDMFLLLAGVHFAAMSVAAAEHSRTLGTWSSLLQSTQAIGDVAASNAEGIQARLAARGMRDIRNLRREGDIYRADALWYGETIDVQVDAATGEIKQPTRLSSKQLEFLLGDAGWDRIGQAERAGDTFSIRAQRDGQSFDLKIDARTGRVVEARRTAAPQKETLTSGEPPQP